MAALTREDLIVRTIARAIGTLPEPMRRAFATSALHANGVRLDSRIAAVLGVAERAGRGFRSDVPVSLMRGIRSDEPCLRAARSTTARRA